MKIIDAIQEKDIRILRVLYDKWKETHVGKLSYDSQTYDYASIYRATGLTKEQFHSHLKNLQNIEFLSYDEQDVKLLPSGINYCLGQFDDMQQ